MKVEVYKLTEVEIHSVRIEVELHDAVSENLPNHLFNDDGELDLLIEVDTGKVVSWQGNEPVSIYDNIRNNGVYTLFDKCGDEVASLDNYYIPHDLIPGKEVNISILILVMMELLQTGLISLMFMSSSNRICETNRQVKPVPLRGRQSEETKCKQQQ